MQNATKRVLSLFLSLTMLFSLLCVTAWADPLEEVTPETPTDGPTDPVDPNPDVIVPDVMVVIPMTELSMKNGETTTLEAQAWNSSTGDATGITYAWQSEGPVTVTGSGSTVTVKANGTGRGKIAVVATLGEKTDYDTVDVIVKADFTPISVTGGTSLTIKSGDQQNVGASISGGSGSYSYDWNAQGSVAIRDEMRQNATLYGMDAGTGSVTLTVYDAEDRSNYALTTWDVTVTSSEAPLEASVTPGALTLTSGKSGTLSVTASGGSGDVSKFSYNWYSDNTKVSCAAGTDGRTCTVTAIGSGSATVKVDVLDGGTGKVKTVSVPVTIESSSVTFNTNASATVGSNMQMSGVFNNIAAEFQRQFGAAVSGGATIQLVTPAGSIGTIRAADGTQVRANESIAYASMQALYFQASKAGTFATGYTLTDGGNSITGSITITASGGSSVTSANLSSTRLEMNPYSSNYLSVNIQPSNASYTVNWSTTNSNVAYIQGSGTSVTINTNGYSGSATITCNVTSNGTTLTRTCLVNVTNSRSRTYNPTLTVTLGSDYYGTNTSDSMAKQFYNAFGYNLNNNATIRFGSTGNTRIGILRQSNGTAMQANRNYTFSEWIDMHFEPIQAGTFSVPYTLTYGNDTLTGTFEIYVRSANVTATINPTVLGMATYSNQSISVTVTPANAYYTVLWSSSNTNIATVTGSGINATVSSRGTTGTTTITATVTDRNGVNVYRSCVVTVSNRGGSVYNPSVSTTIGVPYRGTGTSDAMKSQFRSVYGITLPDSATIRFSSTGNGNVGVMRLANGQPIQANVNYTMGQYVQMYTDPVSVGTFSVPYTLTYNNYSLSGTVSVNVNAGSLTTSVALNSTSPYTFSNASASGAAGSILLANSITNGLGTGWNYIRFGNSGSTVGTLYLNSNRTQASSANVAQANLGQLYFVPSRAGDYSIPFAVYNTAGNTIGSGTLYIAVSSSSGTASVKFADVASSAYYSDPVQWAINRKITNGTGKNKAGQETFSPNRNCETGEIITFLWRSQGSPMPTISNPFTDVSSNAYYYNAALWAYQNGLVTGTRFRATTPCTRGSTVTYMWILAGQPGARQSSFVDTPSGTQLASAVNWALEKNITSGYSKDSAGNNLFGPNETCTRGQIATFLYRAYS